MLSLLFLFHFFVFPPPPVSRDMHVLWYAGKPPDATIKMKTLTSFDSYRDKNSMKCVATGDAVRHAPAGRTLFLKSEGSFYLHVFKLSYFCYPSQHNYSA